MARPSSSAAAGIAAQAVLAAAAAVLVAASGLAPGAWAAGEAADDAAPPYRNHTVGGAAGWFFDANANASSGNYSVWAAGETFYLGDYLIFKTNDNSTVVQTTNATTYGLCDPSDDPTTAIYGGGGGGGGGVEPNSTLAVPLTTEGTNYYFSDAYDGVQCQQGMRFEIKVEHGRGLPPSLAHPPPAPTGRVLAPPPAGTAFSGTGGVEPGDGAGDNGGAGSNAACRTAAAAGGRFLGLAVAMALSVLVAA